jgi:hypothetical protein
VVSEQAKQPMTEAQHEYLKLLSDEAGEPFDEGMDEAAAKARIEELRTITGRGVHERDPDEPVESA